MCVQHAAAVWRRSHCTRLEAGSQETVGSFSPRLQRLRVRSESLLPLPLAPEWRWCDTCFILVKRVKQVGRRVLVSNHTNV